MSAPLPLFCHVFAVQVISDPAILEAAVAGDRTAQQSLLLALHDPVRRSLYRLLLGRYRELDDLTQQVLLRVLTALPSYRFEAEFATWVTGICANVVREHLRKQRRGGTPEEFSEAPSETSVMPLSRLEARDSLGRCAAILEKMAPYHRTAFVLRVIEGHSIDEVAQIMGSAKSTARMRLFYARRAFRRGLRQSSAKAESLACLGFAEEVRGES